MLSIVENDQVTLPVIHLPVLMGGGAVAEELSSLHRLGKYLNPIIELTERIAPELPGLPDVVRVQRQQTDVIGRLHRPGHDGVSLQIDGAGVQRLRWLVLVGPLVPVVEDQRPNGPMYIQLLIHVYRIRFTYLFIHT